MVWADTQKAIQDVVDKAPKAKQYYSDGFDAYLNSFGIPLADMKPQSARRILILSKPKTPNSIIIWLALLGN